MKDDELIDKLPLSRSWLDDIVEVLLHRPNGEAEIDAIVTALMKIERNIGAEAESTVTRTINNYCRNAGDTMKRVKHAIFERVAPGRYRLINHPFRPDLIEVQKISFEDRAYQQAWSLFCEIMAKKERWKIATNRKKLAAFSRHLINDESFRNLLITYGGEPPNV